MDDVDKRIKLIFSWINRFIHVVRCTQLEKLIGGKRKALESLNLIVSKGIMYK
jgi:hypothetical protein